MRQVVEKMEWAMKNDDKAQEIARNARLFARERLPAEQVLPTQIAVNCDVSPTA